MLINSIKLNNFLSFGDTAEAAQLHPLNVIIGPNGSGKSNFLGAIDLLRNAPKELQKTFYNNGGISDWLWKGAEGTPIITVDVVVEYPRKLKPLRYFLVFTIRNQRFYMIDEQIEGENSHSDNESPTWYYQFNSGEPRIKLPDGIRSAKIDAELSILSQRNDPEQYPEITDMANTFNKIKLYCEWSFGTNILLRIPQKADLPNDILESDGSNLGLVLNRLRRDPYAKKQILTALQTLSKGIDDYDVRIEGGTVQVFFQEGNYIIPATRLSDGTLRYLCLLAILCNPTPPPLVCIEEPELGLHPDVLPTLADLMKKASARCQLIVTTHSDILVDSMTDQPESVLICEKGVSGTTLNRLSAKELKPWLEKYRLGELWTSGQLGGTRW